MPPPPKGLRAAKKKKRNSKHITSSTRLLIVATLRLCVAGHSECIEPLVQHGADVDQHIERTGSPLHAACSNQHAGAARTLLQLGEERRDAG